MASSKPFTHGHIYKIRAIKFLKSFVSELNHIDIHSKHSFNELTSRDNKGESSVTFDLESTICL